MPITPEQYIRLFDRVNLLYEHPGRHKRDDKFPPHLARVAADAMAPFLEDRVVILVGRKVAEAFRVELPFHHLTIYQFRRGLRPSQVAVIPHPSGRNQWYNKPGNLEEARVFWRDLKLRGIP